MAGAVDQVHQIRSSPSLRAKRVTSTCGERLPPTGFKAGEVLQQVGDKLERVGVALAVEERARQPRNVDDLALAVRVHDKARLVGHQFVVAAFRRAEVVRRDQLEPLLYASSAYVGVDVGPVQVEQVDVIEAREPVLVIELEVGGTSCRARTNSTSSMPRQLSAGCCARLDSSHRGKPLRPVPTACRRRRRSWSSRCASASLTGW